MVSKKVLFLVIALIVVILDQFFKFLVSYFKPSGGILNYVQNTGAGFGILPGWTFILGLVSLIVAIIVLYYYPKISSDRIVQVLWALFLGGVIGNMIDRLFRGFVIDFIDVGFWPAFNLADACISVSVIGLIIYYWKK